MTKHFTIYWTPEGWEGIGEGNPIPAAGGTGFEGRIEPGSRVYVTNVLKGQLRLLGAFTVREVVLRARDGKPPQATWDAFEYLVAEAGSSTTLKVRPVPREIVEALRFVTKAGKETTVKLDGEGKVNGQAMRSLRELTVESASRLDELLGAKRESDWTEEELRASVKSYLDMARRIREGATAVIKKQYYRDLAARIGRSEKSCEYRMQNISYILTLMGRRWIKGLPPATNVGPNVAARIEGFIGEIEGRSEAPRASEALIVAKARKTLKGRPKGMKLPETTTVTTASFLRDA